MKIDHSAVRRIRESELFDAEWYLEQNPEVKTLAMDPAEHFLLFGARMGRLPGPTNGDPAVGADAAGGAAAVGRIIGRDRGTSRIRAPRKRPVQHSFSAHALPEVDPARLSPRQIEQMLDIRFDPVEKPDVSIIIPVYNQVAFTAVCLNSLAEQIFSGSFEVIVMDDGSSDATERLMSRVAGLRYVRNEHNLGFIQNCNKGASLARGEYLVFLNNDTFLLDGWLEELRATFAVHENVGVAGSKLVYPDGRLQEAGGIIWEDGSGWNWGRLQDPAHPRYNYARDADYISGASIMVPRGLFFELGQFSSELQNSYFEDTWLAFAAREKGYRVVYQPHSRLIHYEGVTSGRDETAGTKKYQAINRSIFLGRWRDALAGNFPNGHNPDRASDRTVNGDIVVIDARTPMPDHDSGSVDMFNLLRILQDQGHRVHFIPQNMAHAEKYTHALQALGVECIHAPFYSSLRDFLLERGDCFSHVIIARTPVAEAFIDDVADLAPSARKIFYTVDMHGLREMREAQLSRNFEKMRHARETLNRELELIDRCDITIVLSEFEAQFLRAMGYENIVIVPLIRDYSEMPRLPGFDERRDVVFIGGFEHTPNVDAVRWLVDEIWPAVRLQCKEKGLEPIKLKIVGSKMPGWMKEIDAPDIEPIGYVEDLDALFCGVRLSIAPLRYGAGLKGKVATSLGYGVPVVGTDMAFEGMPEDTLDSVALIGNDPAALAGRILDHYTEQSAWQDVSKAGVQYVNQHYSVGAIAKHIAMFL